MLPWHSQAYLGAPAASEGGGVEDLQTDVMRFMAMLGLCLVAIFALVQSLPMAPATSEAIASVAPATPSPVAVPAPAPAPVATVPIQEPPPPPTEPVQPAPAPLVAPAEEPVVRPEVPAPMPPRRSPSPPVPTQVPARTPLSPPVEIPTRPAPPPVEVDPPAVRPVTVIREPVTPASPPTPAPLAKVQEPPELPPPPQTSPAPPQTPQFTLRFADTAALLALVQRDEVTLFALDQRGTSRLTPSAGRYAFASATAPSRMHDMDPASVPAQVRAAYARSRGLSAAGVRRWGVVLPPATRRAIDDLLRDPRGGELQIAADGNVRLVPERSSSSINRTSTLAGANS